MAARATGPERYLAGWVKRSLALAALGYALLAGLPAAAADEPSPALLSQHGLRRLSSQHLTLYTDLPAEPAVDDLPHRFDQAVPEWCQYFSVPVERADPWRVTGYLMGDRLRFKAAGLLPPELPTFLHGFTRDDEIWVDNQKSDYYRAHLLLHEGTHSFMFAALDGCGPAWYGEGMAERLATHAFLPDATRLAVYPDRRENFPLWGRIRLVELERDAGRSLGLDELLELRDDAFLEPVAYAWSWAAVAFLDLHPRYHDRLRQLQAEIRGAAWVRPPQEVFGNLWGEAANEWPLFVRDIEFGYDFAATAVDLSAATAVPRAGSTTTIRADRGWQNSGWRVEAGKRYRLHARGRVQVRGGEHPWWSEADGVTIRYYRGHALGQLLACVFEPGSAAGEPGRWTPVEALGTDAELNATASGTLFFKLNDPPSELSDNEGELSIELVTAEP